MASQQQVDDLQAELAKLATLRAEMEQAKATSIEHQAKYVTMHGRHQELWRESLEHRDTIATLRDENAAMKAQLEEANHGLAVSEKLRHKVGADCDYYQKKLAASEAKRKVLAEGLAREYCAWREHKGISIPSTLDYAIRKACEYTAATNALEGT